MFEECNGVQATDVISGIPEGELAKRDAIPEHLLNEMNKWKKSWFTFFFETDPQKVQIRILFEKIQEYLKNSRYQYSSYSDCIELAIAKSNSSEVIKNNEEVKTLLETIKQLDLVQGPIVSVRDRLFGNG